MAVVTHPDPDDLQGATALAGPAITRVAAWAEVASRSATKGERRRGEQLHRIVSDPAGVEFTMRFVDRVIRAADPAVAAEQLSALVAESPLPDFLGPIDRQLLRAGSRLAPRLPRLVMPLAERRLRSMVSHLVLDADPASLRRHLAGRRADGFALNINRLGEAVLGGAEADRRFEQAQALLAEPDIDYVSVKLSAITPRVSAWDRPSAVAHTGARLATLLDRANATTPSTFVNLDMEEYHDLDLTIETFTTVLDRPELLDAEAGIVIQAYLPDSFDALQDLVGWAIARRGRGGAGIKVRLVKGANLAMERVDAELHGWAQAPYDTKAETDANYLRCLDWLLTPERTASVRVGVASHNLFTLAWAALLAERRGVRERVEVEMLEGMAPTYARLLEEEGHAPLLYTPVVARSEFDVAISYLFRRLEENATRENFIRHLVRLSPDGEAFTEQADRFQAALDHRWDTPTGPRRRQDRTTAPTPVSLDAAFRNEPDTDPALAANRAWAAEVVSRAAGTVPDPPDPVDHIDGPRGIDAVVERAVAARRSWAGRPGPERRRLLHRVADELAARRGDLVAVMNAETAKVITEADPEVSEAIDFARWYGDRVDRLVDIPGARFEPFGVIVVAPPWNFPVAIPAGGVLASLAAGNTVILKPAPEATRCARVVAECIWAAGVPTDALQLVAVPENEVGQRLITHPGVDAVILTGGYDTAELFRRWRPGIRLLAETSGKNALVITPNADIDLAVEDLVRSAFGHAGQKCSAASLGICVGSIYHSDRFRRQLVDAVNSLVVGPADELASEVGPLTTDLSEKLERALTTLEPGEEWLVAPIRYGPRLWRPGVRLGVRPGSWFHRTECFGPVLGLMAAADLDAALDAQNGTGFGLTGGIHSLDPTEIDDWVKRVEVGNAYVNRGITGAVVARQPFGGWKRSGVGPGAKAGGPNYVPQLGRWRPDEEPIDAAWLEAARADDNHAWRTEFDRDHDPVGLRCEANRFRYRPLHGVLIRVNDDRDRSETEIRVERVIAAARRCDVPTVLSRAGDEPAETLVRRLGNLGVERIRAVGPAEPAIRAAADRLGIHLADDPITRAGRVELLHYLREQAVSQTMHRYGNLIG
ncbi:MAG: bifunctional proline dehydrogenase/L-glutamate gamma-semialdehyde dehydrogenase [Acidimicrobiales bacterium]